VPGSDRIRLFCALQLPGDVLDVLTRWQAEHVSAGRLVPADHLHATLAFLGARPAAEVPSVVRELAAAAAESGVVHLRERRYRETGGVGMIVFDDVGGAGATLAAGLASRLERIGAYRREQRPWLPHVTVLRFQERPRLEPGLPDLGEVAPSDAAVFISRLRPSGAEYESVETVALGG